MLKIIIVGLKFFNDFCFGFERFSLEIFGPGYENKDDLKLRQYTIFQTFANGESGIMFSGAFFKSFLICYQTVNQIHLIYFRDS